jgi:hypothetical protein
VEKFLTNDNGGTAQVGDFTLRINGNPVISGSPNRVGVGTNSVSEDSFPGYQGSIGGTCDAAGQVTVGRGENRTCTITNDDIPPVLTLNKVVVNDNGGTEPESAWTLTADGPTPLSGSGGPGNADVVSGSSFFAGTYTLSESGPAGYSDNDWVCAGGSQNGNEITLGLGESATCTITNDDIAPTLTVVKSVINDNGGTAQPGDFTVAVTGSNPNPAIFPGDPNGTLVAINAGGYSVNETGPAGYAQSRSEDCSGTLAPGENATCTITNDDIPPVLILNKVVVNDNGGTEPESAWTLTADGPTPLSGSGGPGNADVVSGSSFFAGTYTLSESGPAGYSDNDWVCTGGSQDGNEITLGVGERANCTIINDDIAPTLTVVKSVINDNGGTAQPGDFTVAVNGSNPNPAIFPGDPNGTLVTLDAGGYSVSETGPAGYAQSLSEDCSGNLGLGETVTCAITNDDVAAILIDFETPSLGANERQIIDPYVEGSVTFTAEAGGPGDEVVGLVKNRSTSACVDPSSEDQKLGTGREVSINGGIGLAGFPIRATFSSVVPTQSTVSVEFQTGAGAQVRLRLFDISDNEIASVTEPALPANGTCGFPGDPRASKVVSVTSNQPIAYAIMDVPNNNLVFVIDGFRTD